MTIRSKCPLWVFLTAASIYIVLSVLQHIPIILDPFHTFWGIGKDMLGGMWEAWRGAMALRGEEPLLIDTWTSAPFNPSLIGNMVLDSHQIMVFLITSITNPVFAANLNAFISFPLAGTAMFLLSYYLLQKAGNESPAPGAFIAGLIFMFSTIHFAMLREFNTQGCIYWIPFYMYFFLKYFDTSLRRYGLITALLFAFTLQENPYFAWYQIIFSILYLIFRIYPHYRTHRELFLPYELVKKILFLSILAILFNLNFLVPQLIAFLTPGVSDALRKPSPGAGLGWAPFWHEYFLPNPFHPLWGGKIAEFFAGTRDILLINSFSICPGYVAITAGILAIVMFLKKKSCFVLREMWIFFFLVIVAILVSLPPFFKIGSFKIFSPSGVMLSAVPFRFLGRYSILIVLSLAIFSSFTVSHICSRLKNYRLAVVVAFSLLILFESACDYQYLFTKIEFPPWTYWLQKRPEGLIVNVPIHSVHTLNQTLNLFHQTNHQKRMFNGWATSHYNLRDRLDAEGDPITAGNLGDLGIKIAVYHGNQKPAKKNMHYLKLLKKFNDVSLYRIYPKHPGDQPRKERILRFKKLMYSLYRNRREEDRHMFRSD